MKKRKRKPSKSLPKVYPNSAGIDIGAQFHVVAIPPELDAEPIRTFKSFTGDLYRLVDWLKEKEITTVAMESTGIYWIPLYEMLQACEIEVFLVNARDTKQVPGRKSDVNDAEWLQQLHQYGLLRSSFLPNQEIARLRAYMRQRERLVEYAAAHIQHMQKALHQMNLQLNHVVSDITGITGMRIIRGILGGIHDPRILATYRDVRCKASMETIEKALEGHYHPEHLFALGQAVGLYDTYQKCVVDCDQEIANVLESLRLPEQPTDPLPKPRHRTRQPNELNFDVREALYAMIGVDLTQIHGFGPYLALKMVSECGTDMSKWPTAKHFTSWLCLSPGNKISGGKLLSSATRRTTNRASALLRLSAVNVGKTDTAMGAFYRRLAMRIGKNKAVTATARKIAVMFYNVLRFGMDYQDPGADIYEERYRERVISNLTRRAHKFGFELMAVTEPEGVS
ncbi:MAG: IS110 family transposase [Magnetococcales bacterium]|nr:IS110 family transposase [Magnetococcales bacterium]